MAARGLAAAILVLGAAAAGCAEQPADAERATVAAAEDAGAFRILPDPDFGASKVSPRRPAGVTVTGGTLRSVELTDADGNSVPGKLSGDKRQWLAEEPLDFDMKYRWTGSAIDHQGERYPISGTFRTLAPEELVTATANVVDGGVYPDDLQIGLTFSAPVEDRPAVERALQVSTSPRKPGSWTWSAGNTVATWEPSGRWRPDTQVTFSGELYGVPFGAGRYGADDMRFGFRIHAG